jgi:hypothetical protein
METIKKMKRTDANAHSSYSTFSAGAAWLPVLMLFAMSMLFTGTAFGQMNIKLGATAGLNFATIATDDDEDVVYDIKTGFRGGAVADFGLHKNFSIVPELLFSQKGWKAVGKGDAEGLTQTATLNTIELPINLVLKFKVATDTRITIFPAFYTSYALSGKVKNKEDGGETVSGKLNLGKKEDEMNPLDMGLNLGLGLEVKSVFFRFQLHAGLKNMSNDKSTTANNSAVSLNLGYYIR